MAEHQDPNKNIDRSMAPPMEPQDSWGMVSDRESYSPDEDYESDGPPWPMKFRMGYSAITATGQPNDNLHLNVWKLSICRSSVERTAIGLIRRLPKCFQDLIARFLPGLFLPDRIVLKKTKPGWEEEFENEKSTYERLESLQGRVIPKFYGEAKCEGSRALIFSEVVGIMPWEQPVPPLGVDEFMGLVEVVFQEFNAFGLAYDDVKLDNMIMVGDRVVLVDLESVYEPETEDKRFVFNSDRDQLMVVYKRYLDNYEDDDGW